MNTLKSILKIIRANKPFDYNFNSELLYMGVLPLNGAEDRVKPTFLPEVIYISTRNGLLKECRKEKIYKICQFIEDPMNNLDPNDFIYFKNNKPVYVCIKDLGEYRPFVLPDPQKIKLTSISLFAKVVTYPKTITRMVTRKLKGNGEDNQKSIFKWMVAFGGTMIVVIFMIAVTALGSDKETVEADVYTNPTPQTQQTTPNSKPKADLTIPTPTPNSPAVNEAVQDKGGHSIAVPITEE